MYWTKDPVEAPDFSDWKVSLVHSGSDGDQQDESAKTEEKVVTYHVHRVFLGSRSHYFHRLFSSSSDSSLSFSEAKNCHNKIVLPRTLSDEAFLWTRDAFEIFLDQSYRKELVPATRISLQTLVALWHLVDYLQLTDEFDPKGQCKGVMIRQWMWNTLNAAELERGPGDLYHAVKEFRAAGFNLEKVQSMIAKFCVGKGPSSIALTQISEEADVPLWLDIVSFLSKETNQYDATAWSLNIANFLKKNDVSYGVFQQLTSKSILIEVHPKAAVVFMDLDHDLKASSNESVTEIREQWVDALVKAELQKPENEELRGLAVPVISKYPPLVSLYLKQTLNCFNSEINKLREQNRIETDKLRQQNRIATNKLRIETDKLRQQNRIETDKLQSEIGKLWGEGCKLKEKNQTLRRKKRSLKRKGREDSYVYDLPIYRSTSYPTSQTNVDKDSDSEVDTPAINSRT